MVARRALSGDPICVVRAPRDGRFEEKSPSSNRVSVAEYCVDDVYEFEGRQVKVDEGVKERGNDRVEDWHK